MATPLKTRFPPGLYLIWRIQAHHPASLQFFLQPQDKIFPEKKASRKSTGFWEFRGKRLDELRHGGTGNQMLWTASLQ